MKEKTKLELYSGTNEHVEELMSKEPAWLIQWGVIIISAVIISFLVIAWIIKYPDVIHSEISLTTPLSPIRISSKINGTVENLYFRDNDYVKKRDAILVIKDENNTDYKELNRLKMVLDKIKLSKGSPVNEDVLINGDFRNIGNILDKLFEFQSNIENYNVFLKDIAIRKSINKNDEIIEQYKILIAQNSEKVSLTGEQLNVEKIDVERQKKLFEGQVISKKDFEVTLKEHYEVEKNYANVKTDQHLYKLKILELQKENEGLDIEENALNASLFLQLNNSYKELYNAIHMWEDRYVIKAPMDGKIAFLKHNLTSQSLKAEEEIVAIVPSEEQAIIGEVYMPINGSGKVQIGQRVRIFLDNYPYQEYGILRGQVSSISLLPNNKNYLIKVILPYGLKTSVRKLEFKQELMGYAEIVTEEKNLLQRVFYKFKSLSTAEI
jgi:multidrug resistance efflux pump